MLKIFCKATLLYLLTGCCHVAKAQNYVPFPDSAALWRQYSQWYDGSNSICRDYQIYIQNDTMVNGIGCSNLYWSGTYGLTPNCNMQVFSSGQPLAALREDSAKRIYIYDYNTTAEYLLYDFDLNPGDTIRSEYPLNYYQAGLYIIVSGMDSVVVGTSYRKRYWLDAANWWGGPQSSYACLIEGIGSNYGLLGNLMPNWSEKNDYLLCVNMNGIAVYPAGQACSTVNTSVIETGVQQQVHVYPNPFNDYLIITAPDRHSRLNIYSSEGMLMYSTVLKDVSMRLSAVTFPKGVFLVQLVSDNDIISLRVIK